MNVGTRVRARMNVVLQMVMAFITAILLTQLWLFTIALDAMENHAVSMSVAVVAAVCSLVACIATWMLIRFFLRTEQHETGERS
jgi:fucose 4-O-acetylase-like acetyltransferase